jgi:sugar/nucleoside kinase (ribokinase family)
VANTLAGMASLGAKTAFIGKVKNDQLGQIFTHDLRGVGVQFETPAATSGKATANCLVCVTPDAQRTMVTYLGACNQVSAADIDEALIANSQVFYIEGYLWDLDGAKDAIRAGIKLAKKHGRKVALTLSDTFCVHRFREEFLALIKSDVDILFANESEILALTQAADFEAAVKAIQGACEVAAITRSEKGAVIVTGEKIETVAGEKVSKLLDTTGAGDLFAAGFLYGYSQDYSHTKSAQLGNACAAEIIQQLGARAEKSLKGLAA